MTFTPILAHGGDPRVAFAALILVAFGFMGLSMLFSKKPGDEKQGCMVLVVIGLIFICWFIYSYWQSNHKAN